MKLLTHDEIVAASRPVETNQFVYFLISGGTVVYVGQSETPRQRILSHARVQKFDAYHIIKLPHAANVDDIERAYIYALKPVNNTIRIMPSSFSPSGNTREERIRSRILAGQAPGAAATAEGLNASSFYNSRFYREMMGKTPRGKKAETA